MPNKKVTSSHDQRQWNRFGYATKVQLTLDNQRMIEGTSSDISLSGLFLELQSVPNHIREDDRGEVVITLPNQAPETFSCCVIRVTKRGLALHLYDTKRANFGLGVVQQIFGDLKQAHTEQKASSRRKRR
ncbi:PilZ domain-containing protein [Magnetococcales bacterium HHB-1]